MIDSLLLLIGDHLHVLMLVGLLVTLLMGYPVALTLAGTALLFAVIGMSLCVFEPHRLSNFPLRVVELMNNTQLYAIPLFVLMGVILERSRVAEDLILGLGRVLSRVRGGVGFAIILVGAMLAASTGIVGATVVSMTLIALPSMLAQGYSVRLSTGVIAASGTLGQIIPPSIVLILLADAISNANQQASFASGKLADAPVSVGDLFAGAIVPGMLLVGLYMAWVALNALFNPKACPAGDERSFDAVAEAASVPAIKDVVAGFGAWRMAFALGGPLLLVVAVLGSILGGLATPTEAASVGVAGALFLAGLRISFDPVEAGVAPDPLRRVWQGLILAGLIALVLACALAASGASRAGLAGVTIAACLVALLGLAASAFVLGRQHSLKPALRSTAEITAMVFLILIAAQLFSIVFRELGGDAYIACLLDQIPGGLTGAMIAVMLVMFVLGFFLDFIEITYVVVPIVAPALILMGADPVWLGVMMAVNLQTSFLTPPFGFALFYLRGAAPPSIKTADIWAGALPFVGLQIFALLLVAFFPSLATWLPSLAG
jgi:tripartite ATP-independent transporter DctM subunit